MFYSIVLRNEEEEDEYSFAKIILEFWKVSKRQR